MVVYSRATPMMPCTGVGWQTGFTEWRGVTPLDSLQPCNRYLGSPCEHDNRQGVGRPVGLTAATFGASHGRPAVVALATTLLRVVEYGIRLSEHLDGDGPTRLRHGP
jgi:hypothetical protein